MKRFAFFVIMTLVLCSCNKQHSIKGDFVQVYKFKDGCNHPDKAYVFLSDNKSKVTAYPYKFDNKYFPSQLTNEYFLHSEISYNLAFLSISKKEYEENFSHFNADTLLTLVIEPDPFQEFYSATDNYNLFNKTNGIYPRGIDTTYINQLIKDGDLEKEFTRLK